MKWTKRTRLKMSFGGSFFLAAITIFAIMKGMENLAMTTVGSLSTIIMVYVGSDGYRPSNTTE